MASLRGLTGTADIRSAGTPAVAPNSTHSRMPGIGTRGLVSGVDEAAPFVVARFAEGSDYLKIIVSAPEPSHDAATLAALVAAARAGGRLSVAHAASSDAVGMAVAAGVDVLTHVPLDRPVSNGVRARAVVPTLTMMAGIAARFGAPGRSYAAARDSVAALYEAGVPILAGTDANASPGGPMAISHGDSLHRELALLVEAGLSTVDALRAATVLPATLFGLPDRGVVEPGRRADLVLVDGDPVADIRATRALRRVWCGGVACEVA